MRNSTIQIVFRLLLVGLAACVPKSSPPSNPTTSEPVFPSISALPTIESSQTAQPDLIVQFMYLELEGRQGGCLSADSTYGAYGIRVIIKNIGASNAKPFLVGLNGTIQEVQDGLLADQSIELHFAGTIPSGQYEAIADVADQVVESREDNNTSSFHAPTPTPPPTCVPTAALTTTP